MNRFLWLFGFIALFTLVPSLVLAMPLSIDNASFEDPVRFTGTGAKGSWAPTVPEWNESTSGIGVFEPTSAVLDGVPEGTQTAYLNQGFLEQFIPSSLTPHTRYSLSVAVGNRYDHLLSDFKVSLMAGNSELAFFEGDDADVDEGQFRYFDLSFLALPDDPLLGEQLGIRLANIGGSPQVNFDDVSLDAQAVPEPTAMVLFGSGLLGLAVLSRKRFLRKSS
jgi:hypothetical protein